MMRARFLISLLISVTLFVVGVTYAVTHSTYIRQNTASSSGIITGRVLDSDGQPVSGAEVEGTNFDSPMGRYPIALTDEEGRFVLKNLRTGTYRLTASKEKDGYPSYSDFYSSGFIAARQVAVYEGQTISDVTVFLGPKAAKVTGYVWDEITKTRLKQLKDVRITFRRIDDPKLSLAISPDLEGEFSSLLPPVPCKIEVSAPGYQTWTYGEDNAGNRSDSLKLNPGEVKRLNIALRRQKLSQ